MKYFRTIYTIDFSKSFTLEIEPGHAYKHIREQFGLTDFWISTTNYEEISLVINSQALCRKNHHGYYKIDPNKDSMIETDENGFYAQIKKYFYQQDFQELIK